MAISNSTKRNVPTPVGGSGTYTGSLVDPPFYTDKQRLGLGSDDPIFSGVVVPEDPTGAVNATRLVQIGNMAIAAYDITVAGLSRITYKSGTEFFGTASQTGDPRIVYDWQANRWLATAIDNSAGSLGANLRLMVSKSGEPTPLDTSAWDRYTLNLGMSGWKSDFPTLGYDSNGYYIAMHFFQPSAESPTQTKVKIIAIRKPVSQSTVDAAVAAANATILDPTTSNPQITRYFVQPAVNYDSVGSSGYAWFVAKGAPNSNPSGGARLTYLRLQWGTGSSYSLLDPTPWNNSVAAMSGYLDCDGRSAFVAPQKPYNGANPWKDLFTHGSKLQCAVIRNGQLWTTHHVGINQVDGSYVGDSGRVGYWGLEEGTGAVAGDASGASNQGTLVGGAVWTTGRSGSSSLSFNGSSGYVNAGSSATLVMGDAMTMSAWIQPTASSGGVIVNKEGEYQMALLNGTLQLAFANQNPGWAWINTGYAPPLSQWTHVAITYQSGTIRSYANGVQIHTYPGSGSIGDAIPTQNSFRIGAREFGPSQFFNGGIDDVQVWNRALSAGEVAALLNQLSLRSAVQVIKASVPLTSSTSVTAYRVHDAAATNPNWFFYPSVDVNSAGSVVAGFSGSRVSEYLGAFYWGRKADGSSSQKPVLIHAGNANSQSVQWGHYSGTLADTSGYWWTIQEYSLLPHNSPNIYTVLTRIGMN
ncbi:MAG: LamG domain-containing protein [Verrucomicrobiales bacterium]|nr:LamG domain-containing protein [Verrucomicrobiales bacterium]